MKIHLINYPNRLDTQPIDLENIISISLLDTRFDPNYWNRREIWGYMFNIFPKIGTAINIYYGIALVTSLISLEIDSPEAIKLNEFATNERLKLIEAWTNQ